MKPFLKKQFVKSNFFTWNNFHEVLKKCPESFIETIDPKGNKHSGRRYIDQHTFIISFAKRLWDFSSIKNKIKKDKLFQLNKRHYNWDAHIYGCSKGNERSFSKHNDAAHNFIVQCEGVCKWIVDGLGEKILSPGDMIAVPAQCNHECIPLSKRLSISFPFWDLNTKVIWKKV